MVRTNHYACRNALQTSLIREKIRRRISSTINCEIQNRLQNYNFFWTISNNLQKIRILYNAFNIKKGQGTVIKPPWFVTRERFELPTPTFVASCSDPTELTSQSAEAEGFEPSEPFGSAR